MSNDGLHHIHVELNIKGTLFDIHGVYRPPSYELKSFLELTDCWLSNASSNHSCFIIGDLNVPVNLVRNNSVIKYKQLLESFNFVCSNTHITRPASSNILDHFICKLDDVHRLQNDTIFNDTSDHLPIISSLELSVKAMRVKLTKNIINRAQLMFEFNTIIDSIQNVENVDGCFVNIIDKYNEILSWCTTVVSKLL